MIPALVKRPRTATGNEVWLYANLGVGYQKTLVTRVDGDSFEQDYPWCGEFPDLYLRGIEDDSYFESTVITRKPNMGPVGPIPARSPLGSATPGNLEPTFEGDQVDWVLLPNPDNDFLICFDQGAVTQPDVTLRRIPVKFNVADHWVVQRPENNNLTLNDLFVVSQQGLNRVRGRRCSIIVKITPDGSGVFSEIQYYCNVLLTVRPSNSGSDGNASIDISMDSGFSFFATFTAVTHPAPTN